MSIQKERVPTFRRLMIFGLVSIMSLVVIYRIEKSHYTPSAPIMATVIWNEVPVTYDTDHFNERGVKRVFADKLIKEYGDDIVSVRFEIIDSENSFKTTVSLKNGQTIKLEVLPLPSGQDYLIRPYPE